MEMSETESSADLSLFTPDLVVEVTSVCDLNCPGCYSPTLRTTEDPEKTYREHPEMFLSADQLREAVLGMPIQPESMSLRGGEPSRHPELASVIEVAAETTSKVWVETHARWLADDSPRRRRWVEVLRATNTIVKVSFDKMHHLRTDVLQRITDTLEAENLRWMIAITEPDLPSFERTRQRCHWVGDERIHFQQWVTDHRLLVHPPLGTLTVVGQVQAHPTAKDVIELRTR